MRMKECGSCAASGWRSPEISQSTRALFLQPMRPRHGMPRPMSGARSFGASLSSTKARFSARATIPTPSPDETTRGAGSSVFLDEGFQSRQCLVPLAGNLFEIGAEFLERLRLERELALAPGANVAHDAGAFQHAKMFGDRLPRQARAFREAGDRSRRRPFMRARGRNG
jgi:hypothetical protein